MKRLPFSKSALVLVLVFLFFLSACAVPIPAPLTTAPLAVLEIHFIDVGQGDSILILSPGGKAALIDGGEAKSGALDYLKSVGVRSLDLVVATHPHDDHIGALPEILKAMPVSRVVSNGQEHTTAGYERFLDAVIEAKAEYLEVRRGDVVEYDGLSFEVLNPSTDFHANMNENSVVLRLVYGKISFIFAGDAEKGAEARMLSSGIPLNATILKLGHHASRTSTSPDFLAKVRPSLAVYFAGSGNKYGHPHSETLDALQKAGAAVYGTDRDGTIVITTDGAAYQVKRGQPHSVSPPTEAALFLDKLSVSSPISPGAVASLSTRTLPAADCSITVYVKSGPSQAQGLEAKKAGADGSLSWSWRVGSSTAEGVFPIEVVCSKNGQTVSKEVSYTVRK